MNGKPEKIVAEVALRRMDDRYSACQICFRYLGEDVWYLVETHNAKDCPLAPKETTPTPEPEVRSIERRMTLLDMFKFWE